ncbi:MAG: hypothetical protein K6G26_12010, partial [Lachnospiraceae bacterium]|nr:hypothetical protein [Lachnospiraceae bacterium]
MIKNRVKYIVLLIMILLTCIFYYNIPMIIMTGIYVSLPFLSRYFLHAWAREIKVYVDTDKIMYKK